MALKCPSVSAWACRFIYSLLQLHISMTAWWIHCNRCYQLPSGSHSEQKYFLSSCGHIFCDRCNSKNEIGLRCQICKRRPFVSYGINRTLDQNLQNLFRSPVSLFEASFRKINAILAFQSSQFKTVKEQSKKLKQLCQHLLKERTTLKEQNIFLKRKLVAIAVTRNELTSLIQKFEKSCSYFISQLNRLAEPLNVTRSGTKNICNLKADQSDCSEKFVSIRNSSLANGGGNSFSNDATSSIGEQVPPSAVDVPQNVASLGLYNNVCEGKDDRSSGRSSQSFPLCDSTPMVINKEIESSFSLNSTKKKNPYMMDFWLKRNASVWHSSQGRFSPSSGATWPRLTLGVKHKEYSPSSARLSLKPTRRYGEASSPYDHRLKPLFIKGLRTKATEVK